MKYLVTGATGFLGTNVVHELVEAGHDVRASGHHGSVTKYLDPLPVEVVLADITNAEEVDALVAGCDVVLHVAGDTSFWKKKYAQQRQVNVNGSINVADACLKHGVSRMVHTSTHDVLGHDPGRRLITEASGRFNFDRMGYNYGETKLEAEQQLRRYEAERDLDVVFIYPGFMCGPFDFTLQLGSVFFMLKDGSMPGAPPGGSSFCHVREVARAHVSAVTQGRRGEAYTCAGHNMPIREFFDHMADAIGAPHVKRTLPEWAVVLYGYLAEAWSSVSGKAPDINPGQARYMSKFQYMDCSKAVDELDYIISDVSTMIGDAIEWYRQEGYEL